ncbi:MAG: 5'-3' exonuclease H3TH domain-containing protein [Halioglobus sp.]
MTQSRAWLIDASIYIFRAYFSLPDRWHTKDGMPLNAVYGYAGFLLDFIGSTGASPYVAAAFDESLGTCFRNEILASYKSSRALPDPELEFQLQACRALTEALEIPCYGGPYYEADDYLASIARICANEGVAVTVITRDKDLGLLLVQSHDNWWDFAADVQLDAEAFSARFGVTPAQFAQYQALVGDKVDDIPGVPGVGAKTAAALLQAFGDLDSLASRIDEVSALPIRGAARAQAALQAHWGQVEVAVQLTQLETEIPGVEALPAYAPDTARLGAFTDRLRDLGLPSSLVRRSERLAQEVAA